DLIVFNREAGAVPSRDCCGSATIWRTQVGQCVARNVNISDLAPRNSAKPYYFLGRSARRRSKARERVIPDRNIAGRDRIEIVLHRGILGVEIERSVVDGKYGDCPD